jgi:tRNA-uridine 2-sulfurtransferase
MKKTKVYVGMSGGVDSSVAAALLKKEGYDVTGVFLQVWQPDFLECTRTDDRQEAMRAAAHLGIPFLTFNFEKEYKEKVVDYMVAEYKAGRTPNPDVMCNQYIKFGMFLKRALEEGVDYIATGHYARRGVRPPYERLFVGVDENKDQSYFLWTLTQEQLARTLFPVGDYEKPKVREMARELGLTNAERKDSQGVCFVGKFKMMDFLKHYIEPKKGNVLDLMGDAVGHHEGAYFYTLGQRHGFTVTKKNPDTPPLYVVGKDIKKNTITISSEVERKGVGVKEAVLRNTNFISGAAPTEEEKLMCRFRYRQKLRPCVVGDCPHREETVPSDARFVRVVFVEPQQAVSEGQSLVFYKGDECLGGGIIEKTIKQ